MEHPNGWLFNEPVDVKGLRAVGYYDTIKSPMDLGTVKCRIEKGRYCTPIEFAEDINLTFKNALKFNNRRDAAYCMAEELLEIFTQEWSKIEADFAPLFNNTKTVSLSNWYI
jgi:Bromodomain